MILVRRIRSDEGLLMKTMRLRALLSDPLSFGSTHAREVVFDDALWQTRASEQSAGVDVASFFAFSDDVAAGLVVGKRDETDATLFHVYSMWVAPECRERGVGRALLDELHRWMRDAGGARARLTVTEKAPAAARLYARLGYVDTGETERLTHSPDVVEHVLILFFTDRSRGRPS